MPADLASGLLSFAAYFLGAIAYCAAFCVVYTRLTPHCEFDLIVEEHNASAAIAFGGSLIGFAIALAGAVHNTQSALEFIIWGFVAFATQIIAYLLARLAHPGLSQAIEQNAIAAAVWLGAVSISAGVLSAACMSPVRAMAEPPRKEFGRRGLAPPVVTHAPEGLPGGPSGPFGSRKRTIAIAAIAVGSLSIGTYATIEYAHTVAAIAAGSLSIAYGAIEYAHGRDCAEDANWERQEECRQSHSHGGSGGHSSSGESSSGHAGAASSGHAVSFGGFGAAGHGGGGS